MLEITYTSSHTEKVRCFCLKMNNLASETEKAKIYGIEIKTKAKRELIIKLKLKSSNTTYTHTSHIIYTHSECDCDFDFSTANTEHMCWTDYRFRITQLYTKIPITVDPIITDGSFTKKRRN